MKIIIFLVCMYVRMYVYCKIWVLIFYSGDVLDCSTIFERVKILTEALHLKI